MTMTLTMILPGDEAIVKQEGTDNDRGHAVRPKMNPRDPIIQDPEVDRLHDEMIEIPYRPLFAHAHLTLSCRR